MNIIVYLKTFVGIVNNGLTSRYFDGVYLLFLCARTTKWTGEVNSITTPCHDTTYFPPVGDTGNYTRHCQFADECFFYCTHNVHSYKLTNFTPVGYVVRAEAICKYSSGWWVWGDEKQKNGKMGFRTGSNAVYSCY